MGHGSTNHMPDVFPHFSPKRLGRDKTEKTYATPANGHVLGMKHASHGEEVSPRPGGKRWEPGCRGAGGTRSWTSGRCHNTGTLDK